MNRRLIIIALIVCANLLLNAQEIRDIVTQEGPMMIASIKDLSTTHCYFMIVTQCKVCTGSNAYRSQAFTFAGGAFAKGQVDAFIKKHDGKIAGIVKCKGYTWKNEPSSEEYDNNRKTYTLFYEISCKK